MNNLFFQVMKSQKLKINVDQIHVVQILNVKMAYAPVYLIILAIHTLDAIQNVFWIPNAHEIKLVLIINVLILA